MATGKRIIHGVEVQIWIVLCSIVPGVIFDLSEADAEHGRVGPPKPVLYVLPHRSVLELSIDHMNESLFVELAIFWTEIETHLRPHVKNFGVKAFPLLLRFEKALNTNVKGAILHGIPGHISVWDALELLNAQGIGKPRPNFGTDNVPTPVTLVGS